MSIELLLSARVDGNGCTVIEAHVDEQLLHRDTCNLLYSSEIQRYAAQLHKKVPALTAEIIENELLAIEPSKLERVLDVDGPWDSPEKLPDPLPSVIAYTSDLLPPAIGNAVEDIAERMQCPADFPAAAMLVAMAAVIGCRVGIRPRRSDDWLVVPNLWGCVVGRPSLKKSPAIQKAENRIRCIEARDRERFAGKLEMAAVESMLNQSKIKAKKSAIDKAIRNGDEEEARQLAEEVRDLEECEFPTPRRIITTDPSIEKLGEMLNIHRAGMLLWVDELVGWMRSLDRDDRAGQRQQYLTLWNGRGRLNIDRIGRGETVVESPCVSVFGCATPGGLSDYVRAANRGGRGDDGLVQRLQITVWPDSLKQYTHVDRTPNDSAQRTLEDVFARLADIEPSHFAQKDERDAAIPWVRFDKHGQAVFDEWDQTLQRRLRDGDLPESFESHLSKYGSMVPSIALVVHLANGGTGAVCREAAECAVRWANYLESHAGRVYAIATSPERQVAVRLLKRLIDWPKDKPILARTIWKKNWAGLGDKDSVTRALELLIEFGWIRAEKTNPPTGRPTFEYQLHPEAAKFLACYLNGTPKTPETPSGNTFGGFGCVASNNPKNQSASLDARVKGVV